MAKRGRPRKEYGLLESLIATLAAFGIAASDPENIFSPW